MVHRGVVALLLVATAALTGCGGDDRSEDEETGAVVETGSGPVRGVRHDGVESWRGIPYAAPPVGDLRWRPPEPAEPWTEVLDAREYGPVCLQGPTTNMSIALMEVGSADEDCLTLNVHRPADASSGDARPVMVWIHGGGFVFGGGGEAVYNSPELVKRGVVLVTLNYRLGRLGFLAHPALQDGESRVANYGLLDQVAALEWVQQNAEAFGGDPDNVTLFGESAGGISVNTLMTSPEADGLFARAISQSGFGREPALTWEDGVAESEAAFQPLAGPNASAADLRALPADKVMAVTPSSVPRGQIPFLDDVVPASVAEVFAAGEEADVPYLTGTTDLEVPGDFELAGSVTDEVRAHVLGPGREAAVQAYGSEEELDRHLTSDLLFTEPARLLALDHADDAATYRYYFGIAPAPVLEEAGGAPHTSEIVFVFDDTARQGTAVPDADALADQVADLWVDFATDGEPDGWPEAGTGEVMAFAVDGPRAGPDPWEARLDVVEEAYLQVRGAVAGVV